jgi:gamma-glutamyl-gamma-aminobutyrate hydrolase PuuD
MRPLIAIPARFSSSAAALRFEAEVSARKLVEAVYAACLRAGRPLLAICRGWLLAVQWHPEDTAAGDPAQQRLFGALVSAAAKNRS